MVLECFKGVSRVFQGCLKGCSRTFNVSFKEFRGSLKGVQAVLIEGLKHVCLKGVSWVFQGCFMEF